MPLSEEEQRLLEQMEEALAAEDPKFVSALRGASSRRRRMHLMIFAIVGFVLGICILMAGAIKMLTLVAVGGFVVMLGCAYVALNQWRRMRQPDLPDNVRPIGKAKKHHSPAKPAGFMNKMEDRWRRRRDGY